MDYGIGVKVFGDWEIMKELGEGSYGKVYRVQKTNFGVTAEAAVKVLRIPKSVSEIREALSEGMDEKSVTAHFEGIVQHFVREIAVMSELKSHPNIVSCEDYMVLPHAGALGWDILIRMELLTPLTDYQLTNPMDEKKVRQLGEDLCEALVFCQKKGLIHRDIKPGNVFVDSMGRFKLGDFGVARTAEKTMGGYSKQGTENYMAPEVYFGRPYGARVDIYSLGMMLYRLMNGNRLPFYPPAPEPIRLSDRENALKKRLDGEQLPPPRDASGEFARIILKACANDPEDRYRTAAEMLDDLRGVTASAPIQQKEETRIFTPPTPPTPKVDDDDDKTVNIFGGAGNLPPVVEDEEEDDKTVNIFGGAGMKPPVPTPAPVVTPPQPQVQPAEGLQPRIKVGDVTNIPGRGVVITGMVLGGTISKGANLATENGRFAEVDTITVESKVVSQIHKNQFGAFMLKGIPTYEIKPGSELRMTWDSKGSASERVTQKPVSKPVQPARPAAPNSTGLSNRDEQLLAFWKKHLPSVRVGQYERVHTGNVTVTQRTRFKDYCAPDIPLQILSNAIYNITANRMKKSDILMVQDYTLDLRIPCGNGIVVSKYGMCIQMDANAADVAHIDFTQLKRVWVDTKTVMFQKRSVLCWQLTSGRTFSFSSPLGGRFIDYARLAKILNCEEFKELMRG